MDTAKITFSLMINLLFSLFKLSLIILFFMSIARLYLFLSYGAASEYTALELFNAFWLGLRLDLSMLAYIYIIPIINVTLVWLFNLKSLDKYLYGFFRFYFILMLTLLASVTFSDLIYFSYFGEHITLMIFGVIEDDTMALINTAHEIYNVPLAIFLGLLFYMFLYYVIFKIISKKEIKIVDFTKAKQRLFFITIIALTLFLARGTTNVFPLARYVPDVSTDQLINKLPQTAGHAMVNSYKQFRKSKSGNPDVIKNMGYEGKIDEAFIVHTNNKDINRTDLLKNITYKTSTKENLKGRTPHVVVVMVESFGMPLTNYQSESFNILGSLKKHFDEDILFKNFISSANGTIGSLEPTLLNIPSYPNPTAFSQSMYLNTSFKQASAKVYKDAGYETTFAYGGDVSWRNIGSFMSRQGFDQVVGNAVISDALGVDAKEISNVWGIFDGYVYKYVYEKLLNATTPQFIFILTTNNHPPHKIPQDYVSKSLVLSEDLKNHITGDMNLIEKRFKDYGYALDMAGGFLDNVKSSKLADNSVIVITADNNTAEGVMRYDDHYNQTKRIPFYIYLPKDLKPAKIDMSVASSHKDIFPTLYNLTLYDREYTALGTDLFDESKTHCGFNSAGVLMADDGGFTINKPSSLSQERCKEYYKSSLAVAEYLIKSQK